ncbi:MAG: hypothetical protein AAGI28_13940 [Pseudomonadota bacterium]
MSEKRDYIIKCGQIGLLGAGLFSVGSYLWDKDFFLGEEPSRDVLSQEQLEVMKAESLKIAEVRKLVQPCYARSNDMLNLAASGTAQTSDFLEKARSAQNACEGQLRTAQGSQLDLTDTQQLTLDECKSSLELEIQRASQLSDFAKRPQDQLGQAEEDQMITLRDRANAQRTACETSLAGAGFIGQLKKQAGSKEN